MASRRLRIKPVANVPVRRGKANLENERSDASTNDIKQISSETKNEATVFEDSSASSGNTEENENVQSDVTSSLSNLEDNNGADVSKETPDSAITKEAVKVGSSSSVIITNDHSISSNGENLTGTPVTKSATNNNVVPPGLVRKRMKPAVSISAVNRRPRELNKCSNDISSTNTPSQVDNSVNTKDHDEIINSEVEKSNKSQVDIQKNDKESSFSTVKDRGAGVPGISQIIPTGTAIRPLHDIITGSTPPVVGKGDAPQSLPEPDLPSEGAGVGDVLLKPSSSQSSLSSRSRFIRPTPRIDLVSRNRRPSLSSVRSIESDDESRKCGSLDVASFSSKELPAENSLSDNTETKTGASSNAVESDDESIRSLSDVSTITPPTRKFAEASRARFVKPTPRFIEASARRSSMQGSASESEDENRRTYSQATTITPPSRRHTTDVNSEDIAETTRDESLDEPEKKPRTKRAPSICMQRMAKARQEFQSKFGNKTPDRSRLTMFDLIFYNPTTNPMKSTQESPPTKEKTTKPVTLDDDEEQIMEEKLSEEQVDEPSVPTEEKKDNDNFDEEDMAMPVPQVKVGPDGQIILDEKSLVIETTGAKKGREDLANSEVIIDTGTNGNGFYSRKNKKTKEWSKRETLKFYKALNVIGTDFLLMQTLFPKRTRQDLKIKFKKEDRFNRYLVEKALSNPLDFDLTELEKDLEKEEEEERIKLLKKTTPKPSSSKGKKITRRTSFLVKCMNEEDTGDTPKKNKNALKRENNTEPDEIRPVKRSRRLSGTQNGSSDEENVVDFHYDELQFNTNVDINDENSKIESVNENDYETAVVAEMEYLTKPRKPTRSGRISQPRKHLDIEKEAIQRTQQEEWDECEETESRECDTNVLIGSKNNAFQPRPFEDLTNVEPGSLVVVATESETDPGHHIYKVFMVTPNQTDALAPVTVPLPTGLLHSMSGGLVNENNSCDQRSEPESEMQAEHITCLTSDPLQAEPRHGELPELVPVQQEPEESHLASSEGNEFRPVLTELKPLEQDHPLYAETTPSTDHTDHMSEFVFVQSVNSSGEEINEISSSKQFQCSSDLRDDPLSTEQHTKPLQLTEMNPLVIDMKS